MKGINNMVDLINRDDVLNIIKHNRNDVDKILYYISLLPSKTTTHNDTDEKFIEKILSCQDTDKTDYLDYDSDFMESD